MGNALFYFFNIFQWFWGFSLLLLYLVGTPGNSRVYDIIMHCALCSILLHLAGIPR